MSIDWITVAAQLTNFLVLVWLLKRFLYKPILNGIDAREAEIAEQMQVAAKAREKAEEAEAAYKSQMAALQSHESAVIDGHLKKAEEERDALLAQTHARLEQERKNWVAHMAHEKQKYMTELQRSGASALVALTRKALHDLADETLEQRLVSHAAHHLKAMTEELKSAAETGADAVVTTRDALTKAARTKFAADLNGLVKGLAVRFETDPSQPVGLILRIGSVHLSWTTDSYIEELQAALDENLAGDPALKVGNDGG